MMERERVETEACSESTVLRKTYRGDRLVRAEILHHGKRKGWRLCPYRYDPDSLAYMSSDKLAAYIHTRGQVGFYNAWSDGALSERKISREAWVLECLATMRRDARLLQPKPRRRKKDDGELVVDTEHLAGVQDAYFKLQRTLEIAWQKRRYAEHREDAARAYVLENALIDLTSTWDPCDPKGPRLADERFVYAFGLWAILSFQTRTGHFEEAEALLASELADEGRMRVRLFARRAQTENALAAGLRIHLENPSRAHAIARVRPAFEKICKMVGEPETSELARQLARVDALVCAR